MTKLSSEFPYVLDRKIPCPTFERPITSQVISQLELKKAEAVRAQIGDLLALGIPYALNNNHDGSFIEVYVPGNLHELKKIHESEIQKSGFIDWKVAQGKMHIVKSVFGVLPTIQKFAMLDYGARRNLLDMEGHYGIRDENRRMLTEIFFPEESVHQVRRRRAVYTNVNSFVPNHFELIVRDSRKVHPEIRLGEVIYPLYALELKLEDIEQQLDFAELAKRLQNGKSA